MGLLRLMGNKADVVKGLAKRCNENWSVAPKSDIVCSSALFPPCIVPTAYANPNLLLHRVSISRISKLASPSLVHLPSSRVSSITDRTSTSPLPLTPLPPLLARVLPPVGSSRNDDPELEPLREDPFSFALKLPRPDLNRHDHRQQRDERRPLQDDRARYYPHVRPRFSPLPT
jgi:hypothetical protein